MSGLMQSGGGGGDDSRGMDGGYETPVSFSRFVYRAQPLPEMREAEARHQQPGIPPDPTPHLPNRMHRRMVGNWG